MRDYIYNKTVKYQVPHRQRLEQWIDGMYNWMFTNYNYDSYPVFLEREKALAQELGNILSTVVTREKAVYITSVLFSQLEDLYRELEYDLEGYKRFVLSSKFKSEVLASSPGYLAVFIYRLSHILTKLDIPVLPRMATLYAFRMTGIDIHPEAKIGRGFVLVQGGSVSIGSTVVIGSDVVMYQGVILGEHSREKEISIKKHPTIGNQVVIYANASVLGGQTKIGDRVIIGQNAVVTSSVKEGMIVEVIPEMRIKQIKTK